MEPKALPPAHPVYAKIAEMCRPLYFDDVSFEDLTDMSGTEVLCVTGILPLADGGHYLTIFRGAGDEAMSEPALWLLDRKDRDPGVGAGIYRLDKADRYLSLGPDAAKHAGAAGTLLRLFETAEQGHKDLKGAERQRSFDLLNAACMDVYETAEPEALHPSEHDHGPGEPWFDSVDIFTDLCRRARSRRSASSRARTAGSTSPRTSGPRCWRRRSWSGSSTTRDPGRPCPAIGTASVTP